MKVSIYCSIGNYREAPTDAHTEIEFGPSYGGDGVDYRVFYKSRDGKREQLSSRPMDASEVRQIADALLALLKR